MWKELCLGYYRDTFGFATLPVPEHERFVAAATSPTTMPTLYIHALHFVDPESARRDVYRLERYAVAAFGDRSLRAALDGAARADQRRP